jgi:transposase-like protein
MAQGKERDPKLEQRWRKHLLRQAGSKCNVRNYCLKHGLTESAFYFWRREIAHRDRQSESRLPKQESPDFVPVTIVSSSATSTAIDIKLRNGHRLRVHRDCDRRLLADIVALLEGGPC